MERIIYKSISKYSIISYIVYTSLILFTIIYSLSHFDENPVLIIILCLVLIAVLLIMSVPEVRVTSHELVFIFWGIIKSKRVFNLNEIKSIETDLPLTQGKDFAMEFLPPGFAFISLWNTIIINYKNEEKKEIKTTIYRNQLEGAILAIKQRNNSIQFLP